MEEMGKLFRCKPALKSTVILLKDSCPQKKNMINWLFHPSENIPKDLIGNRLVEACMN
jgi:hypothetical protein